MSQSLPTPEEVAAQASTELVAMRLYDDNPWYHGSPSMPIKWHELRVGQRDEYRLRAKALILEGLGK